MKEVFRGKTLLGMIIPQTLVIYLSEFTTSIHQVRILIGIGITNWRLDLGPPPTMFVP